MTGHGDIPMTVQAMKAGAVDFLSKPFRDQDMLDAVATAIERDHKRREGEQVTHDLQARFESLSCASRILALVAAGLMNKQIAAEIDLAEITVKIHRGRVMKKMGARSLADLVRMAEALGCGAQSRSDWPRGSYAQCPERNRGVLLRCRASARKPKYDFRTPPAGANLVGLP